VAKLSSSSAKLDQWSGAKERGVGGIRGQRHAVPAPSADGVVADPPAAEDGFRVACREGEDVIAGSQGRPGTRRRSGGPWSGRTDPSVDGISGNDRVDGI